jgi:biopolymer transport protein ExbD
MGQAPTRDFDKPMMEMNTTPLIDVMLVLLIMFIITIPVATHTVEIDLPSCGEACRTDAEPDPVKNKIVIDETNQILWNGIPVTEGQMAALLIETTHMAIEPELQFEPTANAGYAIAARTLKTIKATGVSKFGFVGNERYRKFASTEGAN